MKVKCPICGFDNDEIYSYTAQDYYGNDVVFFLYKCKKCEYDYSYSISSVSTITYDQEGKDN